MSFTIIYNRGKPSFMQAISIILTGINVYFFYNLFQQVFQALSTLIGFLLGSDSIIQFGENKIEWLQIFGLLPMCAFIVLLYFLPDTPLYLLEKQDKNNNLIENKDPG